jgi:hypothetical protein
MGTKNTYELEDVHNTVHAMLLASQAQKNEHF